MAIIFWFGCFLAGVGATWRLAYLISSTEISRYSSLSPQDVQATAKLWAFTFALLAFCIMSGFTACMFANKLL